ncbi:hypothetical protein KVT40_000722 [Elsinoe batatas]|uniref:RNA polymerase II subunit B1 CTD phosphatase RPAP2 homolog n=1 Tax=Elsinoe batatas TaxID=2601811 RepID=A0A8K0L9A0_9PEZI|nr:hypothetical protein KVT40_000722 [Elsinoe batatas]
MAAPKSILKKTPSQLQFTVPDGVNIPAPKSDVEARNLRTALMHAEQIRSQKEASLHILSCIETLSLLPSKIPAPAEEVAQFKTDVAIFQPSDYSALLEERNVNGFCGYTLCDNPPKQVQKTKVWLKPEGERRFCSKECARKALYVRAQLDEVPAWERRAGLNNEIRLKDEVEVRELDLPIRVKENVQECDTKALAEERIGKQTGKNVTLITDEIVEKQLTGTSSGGYVKFEFDELVHDSIEGFRVSNKKLGKGKKKSEDEDDDSNEEHA